MRIWFNIIDRIFSKYYTRLERNIPYEIYKLFDNYGINLYEVRFNRCVLSVQQVDNVLNDQGDRFDVVNRMAIKHLLLQYKCMEEGYVYRDYDAFTDPENLDNKITGIEYHPELSKPRIWKQDPKIPKVKSWTYPYISDQDIAAVEKAYEADAQARAQGKDVMDKAKVRDIRDDEPQLDN